MEAYIMNTTIKSTLDSYVKDISGVDGVLRIYLFGSYAYGSPHENSDLDIMVVIDDSHDTVDKATEINFRLAGKRKIPLGLVVNRKTDFDNARNSPTIQKIITEEGVLLHGV
jgi:predicted nucleotidyltransferase